MTAPDLSRAAWRKSARSGGTGGNCVEVASNLHGLVAVRDSKDHEGPALIFTPAQWQAFIAGVKDGTHAVG
ncbi:MAG TPA: DUF397 domain-containing protein [Streptosporangiaceae bacterium]|nr:DUF397 domain-containing protein [Streptosporangiaceae bacterium]